MLFVNKPSGITIQFESADLRQLRRHISRPLRASWLPTCTYATDTGGWTIDGLARCGNNSAGFLNLRSFLHAFIEGGAYDLRRSGQDTLRISVTDMLQATDEHRALTDVETAVSVLAR